MCVTLCMSYSAPVPATAAVSWYCCCSCIPMGSPAFETPIAAVAAVMASAGVTCSCTEPVTTAVGCNILAVTNNDDGSGGCVAAAFFSSSSSSLILSSSLSSNGSGGCVAAGFFSSSSSSSSIISSSLSSNSSSSAASKNL